MKVKEVVARRPRGRPPKQIENRPTACPEGHHGRLLLWGRRTWASAPYRRQRIKCVPADRAAPHTFSIGRRQAAGTHPHGEDCPTCDVRPGIAQGPVARTDHFHTANEIARLLQLTGRGTSLRRSSLTVRLESHHFVEDSHGMRRASRQFALAARYLDLLAPRIDEELAPKRWPRILILDSKPLGIRAYDAEDHVPGWDPRARGGAILAATGGDNPGVPMMAWRIGLAGDETTESWLDFLRGFDPDGPGPEWVVADGAKAIAAAVRQQWPNAVFYSCEFHLGRALRNAAYLDGVFAEAEAHRELVRRAFWSVADWEALGEFARNAGHRKLDDWWRANDALIREQVRLRALSFGFPRSNAATERILDWMDGRFPIRRRYRLRNAPRLRNVFALMRAEQAGQADLTTYAAIVKREMGRLASDEHLAWGTSEDRADKISSLGALIVAADARQRAGNTIYMANAKVKSVVALVEQENRARVSAGLHRLAISASKTPSVDVTGMMLTDFPRVLRDWDAGANARDPLALTAGSGYDAHWKCHRCGHTWHAEVAQRTKRLTRCERCSTERADGLNALAAVRPDLLPEWDAVGNGPLRPAKIKITYDNAVAWHCPDPDHPPYRMSPWARSKITYGCRYCRQRASGQASNQKVA
jgi:hypothetical protein